MSGGVKLHLTCFLTFPTYVKQCFPDGEKNYLYENQGGGTFGTQQVISANANGAYSVYATDIDGDGGADVLSASQADDKIAWYENLTNQYPGSGGVPTESRRGRRSLQPRSGVQEGAVS